MALTPADQVFNRWLRDAEFRAQMNQNPNEALANYNLTDTDRQKLAHLSRKLRRQAKAKRLALRLVRQNFPPPLADTTLTPSAKYPHWFRLN